MRNLVVLTGAGISAESGLATFRDNNGLWCHHRIEDVAAPDAFVRDPQLVHTFYNMRRAQLKEASPNAAHRTLALLAACWQGNFLLVTQNVDDLHDRAFDNITPVAGFQLLHMHGELKKVRCQHCGEIQLWEDDLSTETICIRCSRDGHLRPHIVWFGEMPMGMDIIRRALAECDFFLSIGTSGSVYPAAGFVTQARANGRAHCVELNMEPSRRRSLFHEAIHGPATKVVPEYVEKLLTIW